MFEIDKTFLEVLNKNNKTNPTREYETQWKYIITNIKDEKNPELRRKILNKTFTPHEMATAK